ncbi:MAG: chromosomal replication initiator DnaA [Pseudomonadota bacterium]
MAEQLSLDLPSRTALGRDAFFAAPSNAAALHLVEDWQNWAGRKLVLTGPEGSGKTHLTHVWAALSGAQIVAARDLPHIDIAVEAVRGSIAVEDVPEIASDAHAEALLFHLHNMALAEGQALLLTGRGDVARWGIALPDLKSRIQGSVAVALNAPDDTLLSALLVKLLSDRQLTPKPDLIPYLLSRMDRSFAAAIALVDRLDAASLAQKKPVTRRLAAQVLEARSPLDRP